MPPMPFTSVSIACKISSTLLLLFLRVNPLRNKILFSWRTPNLIPCWSRWRKAKSPSAAASNENIARSNCRVVSYFFVLLADIEVKQLHPTERTIIMATILRIIFAYISLHLCTRVSQWASTLDRQNKSRKKSAKKVAKKVWKTKNESVTLDDTS